MTAPLPAPLPPPLPFDEHDDHLTVEVLNGITLMSPRPALPHMLVRLVVAEQLYRAVSILHNHPYHRE